MFLQNPYAISATLSARCQIDRSWLLGAGDVCASVSLGAVMQGLVASVPLMALQGSLWTSDVHKMHPSTYAVQQANLSDLGPLVNNVSDCQVRRTAFTLVSCTHCCSVYVHGPPDSHKIGVPHLIRVLAAAGHDLGGGAPQNRYHPTGSHGPGSAVLVPIARPPACVRRTCVHARHLSSRSRGCRCRRMRVLAHLRSAASLARRP